MVNILKKLHHILAGSDHKHEWKLAGWVSCPFAHDACQQPVLYCSSCRKVAFGVGFDGKLGAFDRPPFELASFFVCARCGLATPVEEMRHSIFPKGGGDEFVCWTCYREERAAIGDAV